MTTATDSRTAPFPRAGFWRRLGAILYDLLILAALLMLAAGVALALAVGLTSSGLVTLGPEADHASLLAGNWLYRIFLVAVVIWFYVGFWSRGGQTLGMRTWRLRVQNTDGTPITRQQALIRLGTALLGLGNLWAFGAARQALQDRYARCEVVVLSSEANQFRNWR